MRFAVLVAALSLSACSSAPEKKAPPPAPAVKDDTALLPAPNRTGAQIVPDHLLGKTQLPGGTLGDYEAGGKKYQIFIIETPTAQDAAIMLLDLKGALTDPVYLSNFGGYYGMDSARPVFVFAKLRYLAGVVGLPRDQADPIARELAVHLK